MPSLRAARPLRRRSVLLEHWRDRRSGQPAAIADFFGVRTDDYAYVEYVTGEVELYDVHSHPYEHVNQFYANPTVLLQQLSARVAALKGCRGASCRGHAGSRGRPRCPLHRRAPGARRDLISRLPSASFSTGA